MATGEYDDGKAVRRRASLTIGGVAVVPKRTSAWKTADESSAAGVLSPGGSGLVSATGVSGGACVSADGELGPAGALVAPDAGAAPAEADAVVLAGAAAEAPPPEAAGAGAVDADAVAELAVANGSRSGASATSLRSSAPLVDFSRPSIDGGRLSPLPNAAANGELVSATPGSEPASAGAAVVAAVGAVVVGAGAEAAGVLAAGAMAAGVERRNSTGTAIRPTTSSAATGHRRRSTRSRARVLSGLIRRLQQGSRWTRRAPAWSCSAPPGQGHRSQASRPHRSCRSRSCPRPGRPAAACRRWPTPAR